ncbi:MAG: hypothetical protein ABFS32_04670 [Bacteroidota bacterium]
MGGYRLLVKGTLVVGVFVLFMSACLTPPEFPNEPEISFNKIIYKEGGTEFASDTLVLTINFQDGDGNLGFVDDSMDISPPYHQDNYYIKLSDSTYVTLADRALPGFDTLLPPYEFPYTCINYHNTNETDTFYTEPNEYYYNIYVNFFVRKNGIYTEFDWLTLYNDCNTPYHGRFPLLNIPYRDRPLTGKLKYNMESVTGLRPIFRDDTLKLEIYIYDRALNKSNVIETPDFVIKNITVN